MEIVTVPKNEIDIAEEFLKVYSPYKVQFCSIDNKREIKQIKYRVCRFCGKDSTEVTFNKDAHIIPKSLGSKKYLSAEECDICNERFGLMEQHIASFLGFVRTFNSFGKKSPSFESANGNVTMRNHGNAITIMRKDLSKDFIFSNNEQVVEMNTQKYVPSLLYNAILKIAFSILPKDDLMNYEKAIQYLACGEVKLQPHFRKIFITKCTVGYELPHATIFKRKQSFSSKDYPLHIFTLYVLNTSLQIFLPFHDEHNGYKGRIAVLKAPFELLGNYDNSTITSTFTLFDASSNEKVSREDYLRMVLGEEELKNACFIPFS